MASETTAAAAGAVGVVRRDPMAMLPFCGYDMSEYFKHWIEIGETLDEDKAPKIFNVNWSRKDEDGKFMWPGFGDNLRVLDWIIKRCDGEVDAVESEIGYLPKVEDINLKGIEDEVSQDRLQQMLTVDKELWKEEVDGIKKFYSQFNNLPGQLKESLDTLDKNING